jgi:hypothetical protein
MKRLFREVSRARRFKLLGNGGAGQEEKEQDWLSSGLRELERPSVTNRGLKVCPDAILLFGKYPISQRTGC